MYIFIDFLYTFLATMCPSSGENTVPMRYLVFVILKASGQFKITWANARCRIGTVISPDDGHVVARNM
jgi:hypothetical protein